MNRKSRKFESAQVPISSMIDVVFLLLIYFIVTQKEIIAETYLLTDLPSGVPSDPRPPSSLFTIDVGLEHPDNAALDLQVYRVDGRQWQFTDLKQQLLRTGQNDPELTVMINCDPNAKHRKLIQLLDACADAKLTQLNLVNDESKAFNPNRWRSYYDQD